jgi:pre-60S factor REI1
MSKGHCKIAYDTEDDVMEVVDYYDFTPSTANLPEGEDADANFGVQIAEDDMELVLPSGARVGHRSLGRYYKQSLRPTEQDDAVLINKLITSYSSDFGYESHRSRGARGQLLITDGKTGARSAKDAYNDTKHHEDFRSRVGVKANKLQRHFRAQIL